MPRVSIRKLFVYFLAIASCILLALNIQQRATGLFTSSLTPSGSGPTGSSGALSLLPGFRGAGGGGPPPIAVISGGESDDQTPNSNPPVTRHALDGSVLDPSDKSIPDLKHRPWYMRNGEIRPSMSKVSEETGQRIAKVLPDECPGEDRIPEQLMYVPPEGFIPENMDDPDVPLKTILLWNGVGSWGGLRPGRGVFLKGKLIVLQSCFIYVLCNIYVILIL